MSESDPYHCSKCGKLKRKRDGSPHDCGPTQKQRLEAAARDAAIVWAVRQYLHDFLAPDDDIVEAAKRASAELVRRGREIMSLKESELSWATSSSKWCDEACRLRDALQLLLADDEKYGVSIWAEERATIARDALGLPNTKMTQMHSEDGALNPPSA